MPTALVSSPTGMSSPSRSAPRVSRSRSVIIAGLARHRNNKVHSPPKKTLLQAAVPQKRPATVSPRSRRNLPVHEVLRLDPKKLTKTERRQQVCLFLSKHVTPTGRLQKGATREAAETYGYKYTGI